MIAPWMIVVATIVQPQAPHRYHDLSARYATKAECGKGLDRIGRQLDGQVAWCVREFRKSTMTK